MSLRHIVPTLGALALVSTFSTASAIEVGDLTIGGFIDTTFTFESSDGTGSTSGDDSIMDFSANTELQFGYNIGDKVSAQVDIEFDPNNSTVVIEQAYVAYAASDMITVTLGTTETLVGYEAVDAPDLWRVGSSLVNDISPGSTTGVTLTVTPDAEAENGIQADIYIVDALYSADPAAVAGSQLSDDFGIGLSVTYTAEKFFVDVDFATGAGEAAADEDITVFGVNGEFVLLDDKLTLFADIMQKAMNNGTNDLDVFGIMVGANYSINAKMSATLMISTLSEEGDDADAMEVAVALLTNPTEDPNFAVNFEIESISADINQSSGSYTTGGLIGGDNGATAFVVELIAVIP